MPDNQTLITEHGNEEIMIVKVPEQLGKVFMNAPTGAPLGHIDKWLIVRNEKKFTFFVNQVQKSNYVNKVQQQRMDKNKKRSKLEMEHNRSKYQREPVTVESLKRKNEIDDKNVERAFTGTGSRARSLPSDELLVIPDYQLIIPEKYDQKSYLVKRGDENDEVYGKFRKRAEIRPVFNDQYTKSKQQDIMISREFTETLETQLKQNISMKNSLDQRKDSITKRVRGDTEDMKKVIVKLFQIQDNYSLDELASKTQQPTNYLKNLLDELCDFNLKQPNKNTYRLKSHLRLN
ncbi:hypothetical protein SNEBB_004486 [Seison nebaliae]|nr:hypothetical protein SNEBB_004486 [Seison nebaliae]